MSERTRINTNLSTLLVLDLLKIIMNANKLTEKKNKNIHDAVKQKRELSVS